MPGWLVKVLCISAGGALGALSRHTVSQVTSRLWPGTFPWGTFAVNMAGCLLIGFLYGLGERTGQLSTNARLLLIAGFLGAFTTFSSFAHETVGVGADGAWKLAAANILANNVGGIALVLVGAWLSRVL